MADIDDLMERAAMLRREGRLPEAIRLLQEVVAKDPLSQEAWAGLAFMQNRSGLVAEARGSLDRAKQLPGETEALLLAENVVLVAEGRVQESLKPARALVNRYPDTRAYWGILAGGLIASSMWAAAIEVCDEGMARNGESAPLYVSRGLALLDMDAVEGAVQSFCSAVRLARGTGNKRECLYLVLLADALSKRGKRGSATRLLEIALRADRSVPDGLYNLGEQLRRDDPNRALDFFRAGHAADPQDPLPLLGVGWVLNRLQQFADAEGAIREALQLSSGAGCWGHILLGESLAGRGNPRNAGKEYGRAVQCSPRSPAALYMHGHFLLRQGDRAGGNELLRAGEDQERRHPGDVYDLMAHLWDSGREAEAARVMRRQLVRGGHVPYRAYIRDRLSRLALRP